MSEQGEHSLRLPEGTGDGLQYERTALAWERTAIAMMVAGVVLTRYAASDAHVLLSSFGIVQTAGGGLLLVWAGNNHDLLHDLSRPVGAVPQVNLTRAVGIGTVLFTTTALVLAVVLVFVP